MGTEFEEGSSIGGGGISSLGLGMWTLFLGPSLREGEACPEPARITGTLVRVRGVPVCRGTGARAPSSLPALGLWSLPQGLAPPSGPLRENSPGWHVCEVAGVGTTSLRARGGPLTQWPSLPQCRGSVCPSRTLGPPGLLPPSFKELWGFSFWQLCHLLMLLGARPSGL